LIDQALSFELRDVNVTLDGQRVLSNLSLNIEPGSVVAFVGPSGAGKTSALRLLNGMLAADTGKVLADGQEFGTLSSKDRRTVRQRIGFVPQGFGLVPNMPVAQNVLAGRVASQGFWSSLRAALRPSRRELEEVHQLLVTLGIGNKLFQRIDSLSGGEQQRVAIARSLYQEPGALLADEPLSALDPSRARETLELLTQLAADRNLTLVLSLHDIQLARDMLPRLVGLRGGQVAFDSPTSHVDDQAIMDLYRLESNQQSHG
jgi:phosphonate transport system ATP-binding protein